MPTPAAMIASATVGLPVHEPGSVSVALTEKNANEFLCLAVTLSSGVTAIGPSSTPSTPDTFLTISMPLTATLPGDTQTSSKLRGSLAPGCPQCRSLPESRSCSAPASCLQFLCQAINLVVVLRELPRVRLSTHARRIGNSSARSRPPAASLARPRENRGETAGTTLQSHRLRPTPYRMQQPLRSL